MALAFAAKVERRQALSVWCERPVTEGRRKSTQRLSDPFRVAQRLPGSVRLKWDPTKWERRVLVCLQTLTCRRNNVGRDAKLARLGKHAPGRGKRNHTSPHCVQQKIPFV